MSEFQDRMEALGYTKGEVRELENTIGDRPEERYIEYAEAIDTLCLSSKFDLQKIVKFIGQYRKIKFAECRTAPLLSFAELVASRNGLEERAA